MTVHIFENPREDRTDSDNVNRWYARETGQGTFEVYRKTWIGAEVVAVTYTGKGAEIICEAMNMYEGKQEKATFDRPIKLRLR